MSARVVIWVVGGVVGIALAAAVPETLFPGVRPLVAGSTLLLIGLLGDLIQTSLTRRATSNSRETRPADGHVDVARIAGVRSEPNPNDPRFGRFLGPEPIEPDGISARWRDGSAERKSPPLLGRVVIVSLFVGRDGRGWSVEEIAEAHGALLRAGTWVEREAVRYEAPVNIELADTYFEVVDDEADEVLIGFFPEGETVGPFEVGAARKAILATTRAAVQLGFHDALDLFRAVEARVGADAIVWLVHPRKAGRSFAVPREDSALSGVSLAVCYACESSFPEPLVGPARVDAVTVVHELLHLFGASDKYGRSLRSFAPQTVTAREVMRLSETRLSRLRIDPSTASEIGWLADALPKSTTAGANPSDSRRPSEEH